MCLNPTTAGYLDPGGGIATKQLQAVGAPKEVLPFIGLQATSQAFKDMSTVKVSPAAAQASTGLPVPQSADGGAVARKAGSVIVGDDTGTTKGALVT